MPLQPELVTCKPPYKLARVANDTALGMTTKYTFQIYSFCGRETDRQIDYGILLKADNAEQHGHDQGGASWCHRVTQGYE